jgi:hypothetical protein
MSECAPAAAAVGRVLDRVAFRFDPAQPRDAAGRFAPTAADRAANPHYRPYSPDDVRAAPGGAVPGGLAEAAAAWQAGLTPDQDEIVRAYTEAGNVVVNRALRADPDRLSGVPPHLLETVGRLDAAVRAFPRFDPPLTSWRGLDLPTAASLEVIEDGLRAAHAAGAVVSLPGFTSSSLDPAVAQVMSRGVVLEIRSPRGAYLEGLTRKPREYEILHTHNDRFRVVDVQERVPVKGSDPYDPDAVERLRRVYVLEAVPEEPPPLPPAPAKFAAGHNLSAHAAARDGFDGALFAAPPAGKDGDLDPDGHWRTIQGQPVHITGDGAIDAGGHPALRKVLAEKAGLADRTAGRAPAAPAPLGHPEWVAAVLAVLRSGNLRYPPLYERLGLTRDEAKAAKERCEGIAREIGRPLSLAESGAEMAFPGRGPRGERLGNFLRTGDPDRPPPPLPPPGDHPVERAAARLGGWTAATHPTDAAFAAAYPDVHESVAKALPEVRRVLPAATVRDVLALSGWQPGDAAPRVHESRGEVELDVTTSEWAGRSLTTAKLAQVKVRVDDPARGPLVDLVEFNVGRARQGHGEGTRAFAAMAVAAARLGAWSIHAGAVGYGPKAAPATGWEPGVKYRNGYYTWPILGFDCPLAATADDAAHRATLPDPYRHAGTLGELLRMPGGPAAWKAHGYAVSATFMTTPDSDGMRVLAAYTAAKADRAASGRAKP